MSKKSHLFSYTKIMSLMIPEASIKSNLNFIKKPMEFLINNFIMYKPVNINDTYFRLIEQGGANSQSIQLNSIGLTSDRTILLNEITP